MKVTCRRRRAPRHGRGSPRRRRCRDCRGSAGGRPRGCAASAGRAPRSARPGTAPPGRQASARAMLTRWASPPESLPGLPGGQMRDAEHLQRLSRRRRAPRASSRLGTAARWPRCRAPTCSRRYGFCEHAPPCGAAGRAGRRRPGPGAPRTRAVPSACSSPFSAFSRVLLPAPLGPRSTCTRPLRTSKRSTCTRVRPPRPRAGRARP